MATFFPHLNNMNWKIDNKIKKTEKYDTWLLLMNSFYRWHLDCGVVPFFPHLNLIRSVWQIEPL